MNSLLRVLLILVLAGVPAAEAEAQNRRALDHDDYGHWNAIRGQSLSADGQWLHYVLDPHEGDGELFIQRNSDDTRHAVERGTGAELTPDARFAVFRIVPMEDVVKEARENRTRPADMPKDSLGILDLRSGSLEKLEGVKGFELPEENSRWMAYHLEGDDADADPEDADREADPEEPGEEDEDAPEVREKDPGTPLVLRDLTTGEETLFADVTLFHFTPDGSRLVYAVSSEGGVRDGVYVVSTGSGEVRELMTGEGEYTRIAMNEDGSAVAFLSNRDDWAGDPAEDASNTLYRAALGSGTATAVASEGGAGVPEGWWVSPHRTPEFSNDGRRLFFGTAPRPEPEPEEVPESERVDVDIWNWQDDFIQPMQLSRLNQDRRRSYLAVAHLNDGDRVVQLATEEIPTVVVGRDGDSDRALGISDLPYRQMVSWDGRYSDIYLMDARTGEGEKILNQIRGQAQLSPDARYVYWWDGRAEGWFARSVEEEGIVQISEGVPFPVYNELDDRPQPPSPHGMAGWTEDDEAVIVYDRHDLWMLDPSGGRAPRNLTDGAGRDNDLRFRYVRLDRDEETIPLDRDVLLSAFHYDTKAQGFYRDRFASRAGGEGAPARLLMDDASFSSPVAAEDNEDVVLFTRQTWNDFPDLHLSDPAFQSPRRVTDANPQKAEYRWGSVELTEWISTDGIPLQGLLYKPDDFDESREYPMMVYFYERSSHNLHSFHVPRADRASISYPFYVSRDYVVFVPDIPYKPGFPGESAMNAVMPGILELISEGFVDRERIGVQGHSWGGYQIAHMITKTNLFAAAEAGAPVVNMTSAYGGIRWATGSSRMFQYEQTQSRIGATLWDAHERYIANSPLFEAYKVETPLIMMHNDEDGAVPWEQGIEFFVALRRLGKPVWMLNYNGEEHGLTQEANRKDWAIRMQQFFDHYLMDAPPPVWMAEGVPAVLKGRTLGLELVEEGGAVTEEGNDGGH